jgi:hypothetical protein
VIRPNVGFRSSTQPELPHCRPDIDENLSAKGMLRGAPSPRQSMPDAADRVDSTKAKTVVKEEISFCKPPSV